MLSAGDIFLVALFRSPAQTKQIFFFNEESLISYMLYAGGVEVKKATMCVREEAKVL